MKKSTEIATTVTAVAGVAAAASAAFAAFKSILADLDFSTDILFILATVAVGALLGVFSGSIASILRRLSGKRRIFLSYEKADQNLATKIAQELRSAGSEVWMDVERVHVGDDFSAAIEKGMADADFFVLVAKHKPTDSALKELNMAADRGIRIVPFVAPNEIESGLFDNVVSVPLVDPEDESIQKLVAAIDASGR